jgi:hypothetical protein
LLPPVRSASKKTDAPIFAILSAPETFQDSIWTAWSWARFLGDSVRVWFVCDGEIPNAQKKRALTVLPNGEVFSLADIVKITKYNPPELQVCPIHARKLGLIVGLQSYCDLVYCDFDVLAFNDPTELKEGIRTRAKVQYMIETHEIVPDSVFTKKLLKLGLAFDCNLNAGFLNLPKNSLDKSVAEELLRMWGSETPPLLLEQMIISALVSRKDSAVLDSSRYVISGSRMFWHDPDVDYDKIVSRHFTGPVRHVMYLKGLPFLKQAAKAS